MKPALAIACWASCAAIVTASPLPALAQAANPTENRAPTAAAPAGTAAPPAAPYAPPAYGTTAPGGAPPYNPGIYYPPPGYYLPYAPPPPAPEPAATATHLGIGYKIGNGFGFLGGDIIISPLPHVVLDLQASKFSATAGPLTANGYGLAPALQVHIREPGRSTPYIAVGYLYHSVSMGGVSDHASGAFANAGYEWKWSFGMGILLGGGIGYIGDITVSTWDGTLHRDSGMLPMLEASIRFMFL